MINPLIPQMFAQITGNLINTALAEKIDNPYARAAIAPVVDTFVQTVLGGMQLMPNPSTSRAVDPEFLDQAVRHLPETNR